jgi:hypothetical protein
VVNFSFSFVIAHISIFSPIKVLAALFFKSGDLLVPVGAILILLDLFEFLKLLDEFLVNMGIGFFPGITSAGAS